MGHLGYDRTLELIKECFFWPKIYHDVKYFVTKICKCIKDKTPNILPQAPLKTITYSSPTELVELDLFSLDTCTCAFQYLVVITDHFTRYTQVYSTSKKSGKDRVQKLFNAKNSTKHSTTGYAPYFLLFGRNPRLPIDPILELANKITQ